MATLRRDARALIDAVKASGSRVINRFEADDDGVCVSVTLERGHTSNLTLIFEVRYKPVDRCTRPFSRLLESDRPSLSEPPVPVALTLRSRLPLGTQDGYPKGSFVAMSDDDRDETAIARLNAEVADRAGSLTLKDAVAAIGRVFDCEEDARRVVEACIDAPGDDKVGGGDDGILSRDLEYTAAGGSDVSTAGDDDDDDDDCHAYSDEDDSDADGAKTGVDAAVPGELNSDQLTRLYQNKRKCVEREERRVAQKTANDGGGRGEETWDMKAAARNQIFSSKGAFTRLSTELFALQERMDPELAVDAVDHDVYVWDVKFMGGFEPGSGLAEDLETLEAVNGYGYVQLRLHFMADLYPFYPPRVELVRPKLAGIIPGAMTAHPRLHLRNWQPFRPIKSVIEHLRAFLQKFARVDLASELNEIERFPDGAYVDSVSRLEISLARLAACGTSCGPPLIPSRYDEMYEEEIRMETESGATRRGGYETEFDRDDVDIVDFARVLSASTGTDGAGGGGGGVGGGKDGAGTPASRDGKGAGPGPGSTGKIKLKSSSEAKADKRKEYWAKGTGYGHDTPRRAGKDDGDAGSQTWDAAAARGAQAAEDQSVLTLLVEATRFIEALPPNPSGKPGKTRKLARSGVDNPNPGDAASPTLTDAEASRAEARIRASSLPQFLARELKNCSFMNMTARSAYYSSLMRTARALAESRCGDCLLVDGAAGNASALVKTLEDAAVQARIYLRSIDESEVAALATATASLPSPSKESLGGGSNDGGGPGTVRRGGLKSPVMAKPGGVRSPVASSLLVSGGGVSGNAIEKEERRRANQREAIASEVALARLILDAGDSVSAAAHGLGFASGASGGCGGGEVSTRGKGKGKGKGKKGGGGEGDEEAYQSALRPFTYDSAELIAAGHAYAGEARVDLRSGPHISRVAKEIAGLAGGALPLNRSSSAFVRVDDAKSVIWSIMITGPEDTPYDGGCFVFDAFFPSGYPTHAPKIQFKTTGGGRWRANPNLYKDGKVCLSLLGTWQGGKGETWDPTVSTMLQVIVSIQSLILCPRPYFNEPGYERLIGTPEGKSKSDQYDAGVVENTLRWAMIESLKKPHPAFKDVIRTHFRLRKGHLLGPVRDRWTEGATGERKARLDGLFKELEAELKKL